MIMAWHRSNETSRRLVAIPRRRSRARNGSRGQCSRSQDLSLGPQLRGRDRVGTEAELERWQEKLGSVTKQGDRYLRSLLTIGALAVIRRARINGAKHRPWLNALLAPQPTKVAAVALAA